MHLSIRSVWLGLAGVLLLTGCGAGPSGGDAAGPAPKTAEKGPQAAANEGEARTLGAGIYRKHCLMCHQPDGSGVPGMQPPLRDSRQLQEDPADAIRRVLFGVRPGGKGPTPDSRYGNVMPAYGYLDDAEIAACINYVRSAFAGVADSSVSPADVAQVRAEYADTNGSES